MGLAALALTMEAGLLAVILGDAAPESDAARQRMAFWQAVTAGRAAPDAGLERRLAADILALQGKVPAEVLAARRGPMLVRAASALRAAGEPAPQGLRRAVALEDFARDGLAVPFAGFFAVEDFALSFRRFDGGTGGPARREVFVGCDAVTVLPWDPVRDRVLVIEQVRAAPIARGDANPWQIEAVAGRIDPGETPEQAARREAVEEAGLHLGRLVAVGGYYPSPAALSEFLYSYIGLCDLPDDAAGVFGVAAEAEDIRGHLVGLDEMAARMEAGEIGNAPLMLSLLWLLRHRDRLKAEVGAGTPI